MLAQSQLDFLQGSNSRPLGCPLSGCLQAFVLRRLQLGDLRCVEHRRRPLLTRHRAPLTLALRSGGVSLDHSVAHIEPRCPVPCSDPQGQSRFLHISRSCFIPARVKQGTGHPPYSAALRGPAARTGTPTSILFSAPLRALCPLCVPSSPPSSPSRSSRSTRPRQSPAIVEVEYNPRAWISASSSRRTHDRRSLKRA